MPPVKPTIVAKKGEKDVNRLGIGAGNRKCRAAIKYDKGRILDEFFFDDDRIGICNTLSRMQPRGKCSLGQSWNPQETCGWEFTICQKRMGWTPCLPIHARHR